MTRNYQSRTGSGSTSRPPERPEEISGRSSLFSQSGPVGLGSDSGRRSMLGSAPSAPPPQSAMDSQNRYPSPAPPPPAPPADPGEPEIILHDSEHPEPVREYTQPGRPSAYGPSPNMPPPHVHMTSRNGGGFIDVEPSSYQPVIQENSYTHPKATVTGNVYIGSETLISCGASVRCFNPEPATIGDKVNIQENSVVASLPTNVDGSPIKQRIVDVDGGKYSLFIGDNVVLAPHAQVHGPAYIGPNVFIGMNTLVFWARVESGVIIEPGCLIMNVTIPSGVFVPAGLNLTSQMAVKDLPPLTSKYRFNGIGTEILESNERILKGYLNLKR